MESIERRLEKLERLAKSRHEDKSGSPRYLEAYLRALENLERQEAGLPPLPYTEEATKTMRSFCEIRSPSTGRVQDGKHRRRRGF